MNLPPHCSIEGIANVTHLLGDQALPTFASRLDIRRRQIDSIALRALLWLQIHKQLRIPVRIGEDVVVLLDEENVSIEVPGLLHPIPNGVHHPPPVVLEGHDSGSSVVAVLVRIALAPLLLGLVLAPAVPGADAGEGVWEEVRRVGREDLLDLAEVDALHDPVHLREVAVVADDEQRLADALDAGEAVDDEAEVAGSVVHVEHDLEVALGERREAVRVAGRQRVARGERERQRALPRQPRGEGRVEQDLALRHAVVSAADGGGGGGGGGGGAGQARGRGEARAAAEELGDGEDGEDDEEEERGSAGAEAGAVVGVVGGGGGGGGHGEKRNKPLEILTYGRGGMAGSRAAAGGVCCLLGCWCWRVGSARRDRVRVTIRRSWSLELRKPKLDFSSRAAGDCCLLYYFLQWYCVYCPALTAFHVFHLCFICCNTPV